MQKNKIPESPGEQNSPGEKKIKKPYSTRDSLVVPYQSTDLAQRCLTSQFGWDAVLSPWYDRMTMSLCKINTPAWQISPTTRKKETKNPEREIWTPDQRIAALAHFTVLCSTAELPPDEVPSRLGIHAGRDTKKSWHTENYMYKITPDSHGRNLKQRGPGLGKKKEKKITKVIFSESKNAGWISCDRCNKASLHITIPGLEFKSSTNDPREFKSSVAVRTAKVRMVLARRLSELQPMRTPKTSRVLVRFPA